jgi:hypothetical protein
MVLFCFLVNLKTICGENSPSTILFNPQKKKGKKGAKKGKYGFWSNSENLNFEIFTI